MLKRLAAVAAAFSLSLLCAAAITPLKDVPPFPGFPAVPSFPGFPSLPPFDQPTPRLGAPILAPDAFTAASVFCNHSSTCCASLQAALPERVVYAANLSYQASIESYWANQEKISPACIVLPKSDVEVAVAIRALVSHSCRFAVRGGGHTPWVGAANIGPDGVTIDLSSMNQVYYDPNNTLVSVGPGARWGQVYTYLTPLKVAIGGGRAASVGVAGLTTGGGNSFFAARYGFVCDNVANFQVALANGSIISANNQTNPDLFQVLKGGSNNFGIVVRFDFYSFPSGDIWGGLLSWSNSTSPQQLQAFVNFENNLANDHNASWIGIWTYDSTTRLTGILDAFEYTTVPAEPNPPVFDEWFSIPGVVLNTTRVTNLTDLVTELEQAPDRRDIFRTITFQLDLTILQKAVDVYNEANAYAQSKAVGNFSANILFQAIPSFFGKYAAAKGGNVLGLDQYNQNLVLFLWDMSWDSPIDDALMNEVSHNAVSQINQFADSLGKSNPYVYLNYADADQNPLAGYGAENVEKIRNASIKYDPRQVFQYLVPGGYKINKVPMAPLNGTNTTSV